MQDRRAQIVGVLLAAVLLTLAFAPASPAKVVVDSFGFPGPQGGHLNRPMGIAINQTGAGGVAAGTLYVGEGLEAGEGTDSNRIHRLDAEGDFERLWGLDVVGPNEIQTVSIAFGAKGNALTVGGSFSLTFEGETAEFALGEVGSTITPTLETVQSGLEALPSIGSGNVRVLGGMSTGEAGGSFEIEFTGALGGTDLAELVIDDEAIEGPEPITTSVSTLQDGSGGPFAGFEICMIAAECKRGSTAEPAPGGQVHDPAGVAVDRATGDLYVADAGDNRIEKFDVDGKFLRAWGWDVVKSGGAGDISSDAFEICTVATDCKEGVSSENGGAVGFAWIDLTPAGNVLIADPVNRRFQEFEPDGSFVAAYGWDVVPGGSVGLEECTSTAPGACQAATPGSEPGQFGGSGAPSSMTIDSAGFLYAIDDANKRIQRFSPDMSTATQFAPNLFAETGISSLFGSRIVDLPGGGFLLSVRVSGEDRLFELDASGQVIETSLVGDGLPNVQALAVNETTGTIYATVSNTEGVRPTGPGVAIIDDGPPQAPPVLTIEPVSGVDAEEATFHAKVDPGGLLVADCRFQYSTDQVSWKDVPEPDCASLERDGGAQQVSETVEGLEPGTHYFVRFGAGRYYYADGDAVSSETEFTTISLPPVVSDVGAAQVTHTSAYLAGEIKPRSQSFEYHFEYGTTPALGTSIPIPDVQESGSQQRVVAHLLEGLAPQTTYFLRLVATNPVDTTESPVVSFRTRPAMPPPPPRAYEQVTPPEKNFNNLETGFSGADGEAVVVGATVGFGDPPGQIGEISTGYRAVRTDAGWRTRWHNETYCSKDLEDTHFQPAIGGSPSGYSENLDLLAILRPEASFCPYPPLDPAAPTPQTNLYRADWRGVASGGAIGYDLLAPEPGGELGLKQTAGRYAAASDDWSHVVYTSAGKQTPDAPVGDFRKVFEWEEGTLRLVSKNPANIPFTTPSAVPEDALHGVSGEGNRIFFMNPVTEFGACTPASCEIYMRQNGTKTIDVSQSECTSSCGSSAPDQFLAATADGAKVLFESQAKLTDTDAGTGSDLFLYTHSADPSVANLTLLSKDQEPADGSGAGVLGLLGISEDAQIAYFAAEGQLVAGESIAAGAKLYRWAANEGSPTLDYLTTLGIGSEDAGNWSGAGPNNTRGTVRAVTPSGEHLLVHSAARIDRGADHDQDADIYRWSEAEGWLCASCQVPSTPSAGDVALAVNSIFNHYQHAMSEDGGQIFFAAADALAAGDSNTHRDVYEWREDGTLALLSSGRDSRDVKFLGASTSGRDVFFTTFQRLVGWDSDESSDIYDARVGGGFPEPIPPPPPCDPNGGECEGSIHDPPQRQQPVTPEIETPDNQPNHCAALARRAKRLAQRAKRLRGAGEARKAARLGRKAAQLRKRARHCRATGEGRHR